MSSDALADLDDLLNELESNTKKSPATTSTPAPKPTPAPAPQPTQPTPVPQQSKTTQQTTATPPPQTQTQNSSNQTTGGQWKDELEGLLQELSVAEPKSSPSQPQPYQSHQPVPQARTIVSAPPPTYDNQAFEQIDFVPTDQVLQLTNFEAALVRELNFARTHPQEYASILEKERRPYFDGKNLKLPGSNVILVTEEGVRAVDEAIDFLRKQKPLAPFSVSAGMTKSAREAVEEVGKSGDTTCESIKRIEKYGRFEQEAVEIASFGTSDAREIVVRFVVCDGSSDRIQRAYIFEPIYGAVGLSIGEHNSQYKTIACINFTKMFHPKK